MDNEEQHLGDEEEAIGSPPPHSPEEWRVNLAVVPPALWPCPFCGRRADAFGCPGEGPNLDPDLHWWMVECRGCQAASARFVSTSAAGSRANAVEAWNQRPPTPLSSFC